MPGGAPPIALQELVAAGKFLERNLWK